MLPQPRKIVAAIQFLQQLVFAEHMDIFRAYADWCWIAG